MLMEVDLQNPKFTSVRFCVSCEWTEFGGEMQNGERGSRGGFRVNWAEVNFSFPKTACGLRRGRLGF